MCDGVGDAGLHVDVEIRYRKGAHLATCRHDNDAGLFVTVLLENINELHHRWVCTRKGFRGRNSSEWLSQSADGMFGVEVRRGSSYRRMYEYQGDSRNRR